jgi:hypothetical protein
MVARAVRNSDGALGLVDRGEWDEQPVADLDVEDRDADPVVGEQVSVGAGDAADQAVEA